MIKKILKEIYRIKTSLILLAIWLVTWGWKDSLMTVSFLTGFVALSVILGYIASKEFLGKYRWDVGTRLNYAWSDEGTLKDAILAVGMLTARVMIYIAIVIAMAITLIVLKGNAFGATAYDRAKPLLPVLVEEHKTIWPESDVAIIASQINAESLWKEKAKRIERSGVVSYGLMQVLDSTLNNMKTRHSTLNNITPVKMLRAKWGIRAGILYDKDMWKLCNFGSDECSRCHSSDWNRWAFTLASYNGGFGNIQRDRILTEISGFNRDTWFGHVALFSGRSKQNFKINREYPDKILKDVSMWRGYFDNL